MNQAPSPAPTSPCIQVCRIVPESGLCEGCGRTLAEITAWFSADNAQRRAILAAVDSRLASMAAKA